VGYKDGESGISVLLGKETTPGTEASTIATKLGLIQNISSKTGFDMIEGNTSFSQDRRYATAGKKIANWDVDFIVQNFQFLYYILGTHAVTGTGPYTHTLSQANKLPSYSAELIDDDLGVSLKMLGSKADSLDLKCTAGEEISASMGWKAMDHTKEVTPQSAAEIDTDPWVFDQVSVFSLDSVSKVDVATDISVKYNRNVDPRTTVGSKTPRFVKEGKRPWELTIEQYQDDVELYDLVANETAFATQLKFVKNASNDEATLTFNQCRVFDPGYGFGGDDALKESFSVIPYAKSGQTLVTVSVIDSIADYTA